MNEFVAYLVFATIALVVIGFMLGTVAAEIRSERAARRNRRRRGGMIR